MKKEKILINCLITSLIIFPLFLWNIYLDIECCLDCQVLIREECWKKVGVGIFSLIITIINLYIIFCLKKVLRELNE